MESAVIQRVIEFMKFNKLNKTEFSKALNLPQPTVNQWLNFKAKTPLSFIVAMLESFENLSAEWLMRGNGAMIKDDANNISSSNIVNGNDNNNINQTCSQSATRKLSARLIASALRGCKNNEEQEILIKELDELFI